MMARPATPMASAARDGLAVGHALARSPVSSSRNVSASMENPKSFGS